MKLSRKCEYALLALLYLGRHRGNLVKINDISTAQKIPRKFLEQILLILKGGGYVKSRRGVNGGYKLRIDAEDITIAEIIRLFDGALAAVESASENFYESTPLEQSDKLLKIFKDIRDYIADYLENTTLADLLEDNLNSSK